MKRIFTLLFIFSLGFSFAQQVPDFSLFRENAFIYNPAVAGTDQADVIFLTARKQWTNIKASPFTIVAAYHTSLEKKHIGVGAQIFNDFSGPTSYSGITGAFAYNLVLSKYQSGVSNYKVLSFGLSASLVQYRINGDKIKLDQPQDNTIFNGRRSQFFPDAAFGIYYKSKKFFASASIPQLLNLNVPFQGDGAGVTKFKKMQHYYTMFGGRIFFGEKKSVNNSAKFYLEPGVNFHYVIGSMPQVMVSTRFAMQETFFVGLGYRTLNTIMMEGGFTIKKVFSLSYAYDMGAGNVRRNVGQVHEISLRYMFNQDFWSY